MKDNVVFLDVWTKGEIPVVRLVENTEWDQFETFVVIGKTKDGEHYVACNKSDANAVMALCSKTIHKINNGDYDT